MPAPSDQLIDRLTQLELCSSADIVACEPLVRKLCDGLPDFESVWLDALVQRRILTPWQAAQFQTATSDLIRRGSYLVLEPLGSRTFLAKHIKTSHICVLHEVVSTNREQHRVKLSRVHELLNQCDSLQTESLSLPIDVIDESDSNCLLIANEFIPGWNLQELLVRGGRIPSSSVAEIGLDLLQGLACLEKSRLAHGCITLRNVIVTQQGRAVFVAPFIARLRKPTVTLEANLKLEEIEFLAPEMAGTGRTEDHRSELYSLGCVLWNTLSCRPTFLTADPLRRLSAARSSDVEDIRTWVPDCPDWMARSIHGMTRKSSEIRPGSVSEVLQNWEAGTNRSHRHLRSLIKRLPDLSSRSVTTTSHRQRFPAFNRGLALTAVLLMAILITGGIQQGLIPSTLKLGDQHNEDSSEIAAQINDTPKEEPVVLSSSPSDPLAFPKPNQTGLIVLRSGAWYQAADQSFAGELTIRSSGTGPAHVLISENAPWKLTAIKLNLQGIIVGRRSTLTVQRETSESTSHLELIQSDCDSLAVAQCLLIGESSQRSQACLSWRSLSDRPLDVVVTDSAILGGGWGLHLNDKPQHCEFRNVLTTNSGASIRCDIHKASGSDHEFLATNVTQTTGAGFLDVLIHSDVASSFRTRIIADSCVIDSQMAVVRVASAGDDEQWRQAEVEVRLPEGGQLSILSDQVQPAVYVDRKLNSVVNLPESQLLVEGLLIANPLFNTQTDSQDTEFSLERLQLLDFEGPKVGTELPGVDVSRLPAFRFPKNL